VGPTCPTPRRAGPARQHTVATWLPCDARLTRALRPLSGQRATHPDSPALAPAPTTPRLTRAVVAPTASRAPPSPRPPHRPRRRPDRSRSPVDATPHRHLRAGEPHIPRSSPERRRRAAASSSSSAAAERCAARCAGRPSWATHAAPAEAVGRASVASTGRAPRGCGLCARVAAPGLCDWAERDFGPVALGFFIYFLIYSIHCKFKNLCRIHLNSENYETNFVEKV
jgi:hypothetical protein